MTGAELALALVACLAAFVVSSGAGLGGSLILVPALSALLGTKEGVALAALLLAANNVAKTVAYRNALPVRRSVPLVVATVIGTWAGASLLTVVDESLVTVAVIVSIVASLAYEVTTHSSRRPVGSPAMALGSGLTSGFSGTSGPLKGVAVRGLGLGPRETAGAATLLSLFGDLTKTATFTAAGLLTGAELMVAVTATPLMIAGTAIGYRLNGRLSLAGFAAFFWAVMGAYVLRLGGLIG